jgi:uncharacterized protein (TIGR00266 family)
MRHQILYQPSYSLALVQLDRGEQIMAESGAMVSMSPTIKLEAKMSGGGVFGALKSAVGGESLFRTTFTAESGPGEIALAPATVGDVLAVELQGSRFFVQPGSYLAGDARLSSTSRAALRRCSREGLFSAGVEGSGLLCSPPSAPSTPRAGGRRGVHRRHGHIVAFEHTVTYRIEKATGQSQGLGGFLKGMVQSTWRARASCAGTGDRADLPADAAAQGFASQPYPSCPRRPTRTGPDRRPCRPKSQAGGPVGPARLSASGVASMKAFSGEPWRAEVLSWRRSRPGTAARRGLDRVDAAGVNFVEIYQRTGRVPLPLPYTLGGEAAGEVVAVGLG